MDNAIAELFKDEKYCRDEMCRIRDIIGKKTANENDFRAASTTLGFIYFHCPEDMKDSVYAQMLETTKREGFAIMHNPDFFKD